MSTRHNYTNPAFCQQSEFYSTSSLKELQQQQRNQNNKLSKLYFNSPLLPVNKGLNDRFNQHYIKRSASTRSYHTPTSVSERKTNTVDHCEIKSISQTNPKPGLKSTATLNLQDNFQTRSESRRYALVPVEELSNTNITNSYTIVPKSSDFELKRKKAVSSSFTDIHEICHFSNLQENNHSDNSHKEEHNSTTYTSLPPMIIPEVSCLKAAFSSDFGNKSFVLLDNKNIQKFEIFPTEDDEDLVDDNREIIKMHNGRFHRYAVIPTEEEAFEENETCLTNPDFNCTYNNSKQIIPLQPVQTSTPQKNPFKQQSHHSQQLTLLSNEDHSYPSTPRKNPDATRKLHELLSSPRIAASKVSNMKRIGINRNFNQKTTPNYAERTEFSAQNSQYELEDEQKLKSQSQKLKNKEKVSSRTELRTTAVITPRVAQANAFDNYNENTLTKSSWNTSYPEKVANATATLGVISLMLILGSIMNSAICLFIIANNGRTFYLEFALAAAFAGVGLGTLGFRSRRSEWLPNRSYISGYILVTVFCLLKCCGLLVLLALDPFPGIPLHDVTTGIILGLSTFEIFFIGLGVLGSWWCHRPPPDNRVNVF